MIVRQKHTFSLRAFHLSFIFSRSFSSCWVETPCSADLTSPCPILLQCATFCPNGSKVLLLSSAKSFCWARICSTSEDTGFRLRTCSAACGNNKEYSETAVTVIVLVVYLACVSYHVNTRESLNHKWKIFDIKYDGCHKNFNSNSSIGRKINGGNWVG